MSLHRKFHTRFHFGLPLVRTVIEWEAHHQQSFHTHSQVEPSTCGCHSHTKYTSLSSSTWAMGGHQAQDPHPPTPHSLRAPGSLSLVNLIFAAAYFAGVFQMAWRDGVRPQMHFSGTCVHEKGTLPNKYTCAIPHPLQSSLWMSLYIFTILWSHCFLWDLNWGLEMPTVTYGPQAKSGPLPVFVNKALLEHSHSRSFTYFSFCAVPAEP